jgi:hypothetical protein
MAVLLPPSQFFCELSASSDIPLPGSISPSGDNLRLDPTAGFFRHPYSDVMATQSSQRAKPDSRRDAVSPPTPGVEQTELGVFLGRWHTTGEVAATASTPAARVDSIDTYEWYPGEYFLIHEADSNVGDDRIQSLEVIGYDAKQRRYFATFFDSTGGSGIEELRRDGATWTWRGSNVMGVREHRCIAVVSDDRRAIRARHEKSDDGKNWTLWIDVTLAKES